MGAFKISFCVLPIDDKHYEHFMLYVYLFGRRLWIRKFNGKWKYS